MNSAHELLVDLHKAGTQGQSSLTQNHIGIVLLCVDFLHAQLEEQRTQRTGHSKKVSILALDFLFLFFFSFLGSFYRWMNHIGGGTKKIQSKPELAEAYIWRH